MLVMLGGSCGSVESEGRLMLVMFWLSWLRGKRRPADAGDVLAGVAAWNTKAG